MEEIVFAADPVRLIAAAVVGIAILLILIIRFKLHPIISMMLSAVIIGVGAGMPLSMISETVEKGVGKTLQGIALLVGLGSMFGGILEASGGAQKIAETLIDKFGQKKAGWALGITGLVIGTTVFFEAGVVVLIPLVFSVVRTTKKSTLMYFLGIRRGFTGAQIKAIFDKSLKPTGMILLVIASGGVIRWMLQDSGLGNIIGPILESSSMPLILVAFLIALLVRASVGSSIVAMTMASGIMASMPAVMETSMLYRAAMCCAICGGATALSHVNDAGFWLVGTFLHIDEKTTLKSWTVMETLIGISALIVSMIISIVA